MLNFYCKLLENSFSFLVFLLLIFAASHTVDLESTIAGNLPDVSGVTSDSSPLSSLSRCYYCFIAVKNHNCTGFFSHG